MNKTELFAASCNSPFLVLLIRGPKGYQVPLLFVKSLKFGELVTAKPVLSGQLSKSGKHCNFHLY